LEGYCSECDECHRTDDACENYGWLSKKSRPSKLKRDTRYYDRMRWDLLNYGDEIEGEEDEESE